MASECMHEVAPEVGPPQGQRRVQPGLQRGKHRVTPGLGSQCPAVPILVAQGAQTPALSCHGLQPVGKQRAR